jgi:prevent-host-death family protein
MRVNIHDAKTNLSRLVAAAEAGEDVVIARAGRPVARLVPYTEIAPRVPGNLRITIADDFDELPEDLAAAFRGERP